MEAIRLAQVWTPVNISSLDLKAGPQMRGAFAPGETVTCDYFDKDSGGKTPKFWCRISADDEVKVKYGEDNGEVYAEVAATRLFGRLGFGADGMYPVKVICRGCSADPFNAEGKQPGRRQPSHTFDPACIERPIPGT